METLFDELVWPRNHKSKYLYFFSMGRSTTRVTIKQTLFVRGDFGISTCSKQHLGKIPFSISLRAAFINGKQTPTASLKSLSWLSSFFLKRKDYRYIVKTIKSDQSFQQYTLNDRQIPVKWYRYRWHTTKQWLPCTSNNTWVKPGNSEVVQIITKFYADIEITTKRGRKCQFITSIWAIVTNKTISNYKFVLNYSSLKERS